MRESDPTSTTTDASQQVLYTVDDAAKLMGIGRTKAWSLVASGELESVKIGDLRRVPRQAILNFIERGTAA